MRKWYITSEKIRILHIGGNLRINGISAFILNLLDALDPQRFEINVVNSAADEGHYKIKIESYGGKTYSIYTPGSGISRTLGQMKKLRSILVKDGPFDVVHSHYFSNNGLFLKVASEAGVPVRISHCHQSNPTITGIRKIEVSLSRFLLKKYATHKLGVSNTACQFLYGQDPSQVLYTGIDYDKYDVKKINTQQVYAKHGLNPCKKYLLHIGRFAEQKNQFFLLDLFRQLAMKNDALDLIIVGHGVLKDQIKQKVQDMNLTARVHFLNPDINLAEIYCIASCFLLPSLWEGLGIVLIEAQAMGLRCFVSDRITHETDLGLCTYLPLKLESWVNTIHEYIIQSHKETPLYNERFDTKKIVQQIEKIYVEPIAERYCDIAKELSLGSINYKCDKTKSIEFYKKAHYLDNPRGTFGYALAFFEGNAISRDRTKAQQLVSPVINVIQERAIGRDPRYQVIYGDMFSFGLGKPLNFEEAFKWYQKAAAQNNTEALCDLGFCYLVGQGVEKNLQLSSKFWLQSAKLGYTHSCRDIGQNYLKGIGVKRNPKKAVHWFKVSASYNYSHGSSDLAYCYLHGFGVKKNLEFAKIYFRKALDQDYDRGSRAILAAHINLKRFIEEGIMEFDESEILMVNGNDRIYKGTLFVNDHIKSIDPKTFYNSDKLEKILVDTDNPTYSSIDGILFTKDRTILLKFPIGRKVETYQVPSSVVEIGAYAFQNCRYLKKILFNQKIRKIGKGSFDDCKNLDGIEFDSCVKEIGEWAFHACDKIKQFIIGPTVEKIGKYAFGSCESLESIQVDLNNPNFTSIEDNLYSKDAKILLQYAIAKPEPIFKLPASVEIIAFRAVSDALHLEKVFLPNVKKIEEKAFYYDLNLREVHFMIPPIFEGTQIFDSTHQDLKLILNHNQILEYKHDSARR
jgi:glycosyltransferase EpsF